MTYGFNADAMDGSEGTIRTHSRFFFESISNERNQEEVSIMLYLDWTWKTDPV